MSSLLASNQGRLWLLPSARKYRLFARVTLFGLEYFLQLHVLVKRECKLEGL